jgi:uncharacterized membrane protein YfcA
MDISFILLSCGLFLIIAMLYTSVGHAGASGYLAVMALLSFSPESIKPTSIILNIVVASIASYHYLKSFYFNLRIFLAFVVTSMPAAYLGGTLTLPSNYFKLFTGIFLLISALAIISRTLLHQNEIETKEMPIHYGLFLGAIIGFISGIIGVGGGIFLSPILILTKWTNAKQASGIAALFILVNSIAGLMGHISSIKTIDENIFYWIIAVIVGGIIGSYLGTKKLHTQIILYLLSLVLFSAGIKFIFLDFIL